MNRGLHACLCGRIPKKGAPAPRSGTPPDGHTLMVTGSNFAGSAALYSKLAKEAGQILELSDIKEPNANPGAAARPSSPEAFDKLVHNEITTRRKVWKAAGVTAE